MTQKEKVIQLLESTKREGMSDLIKDLESRGYFESSASTKFHGNYPGGLVDHSLNLYHCLLDICDKYGIEVPQDTLIIVSLLHDFCKAGKYIRNMINKSHPKGHAKLTLNRIKELIILTRLEAKMIMFHMGVYNTLEYAHGKPWVDGEYLMKDWMIECHIDPRIKLIHWCDDLVSQFVDIKK